MADYKKIVRSSHFTFLVGSDKTPLTIHAAIVQDMSDPLYALINNGHMEESNTGVATLEDVEVETFVGFCEYAYTGAYVTPSFTLCQPAKSAFDINPDDNIDRSNHVSVKDSEEPPPDPDPFQELEQPSMIESDPRDSFHATRRNMVKKRHKIKNYKGLSDQSPAPSFVPITIIYPYEQLWEQFRSLRFNSKPASLSPAPNLLFHAKLYVFATKYLIDPLRQQCLSSVHRDLCNFSPNQDNICLIFELLGFTYTHTGRVEPGGKSPFRDLIIHYIACEVRTLADYEKLTELLDSNGEIGSDLVMKLVG